MCNGAHCKIEKGNEGPTLNHSYNDVLKRWAQAGSPSLPECEECGEDLTGKEVYETSTQWLCKGCKEKDDERPIQPYYREDFHADG